MEINEQIKQMAMRLRGLREDLDMSVEEVASKCGIVFGVEPLELFSGDAPNMSSYWLVRKGKGPVIERQKAYKYQALAMGFKHAKASPFIVTVDPKMENEMHLNSHEGQEFNLVLKGTLLLSIGGKELTLNPGDSIYFDSTQPHGMRALNGEPARFLAIIF